MKQLNTDELAQISGGKGFWPVDVVLDVLDSIYTGFRDAWRDMNKKGQFKY